MLEPYRCIGWNPRVCDPGLIHQHRCTSVLVGDKDVVQHCDVRMLPLPQYVFTVTTLSSRLVLFVETRVTLKERWPGDPTPEQANLD